MPGLVRFLLFATALSGRAVAEDANKLTYEEHIRPIFRAHCFDCHGAADELSGGLDLRLVRLMKAGGDSGRAIVANDPSKSYLLERIRLGEMPPGEGQVSTKEFDTLVRWMTAGAPTARPEPDSLPAGLGVTPEERSFWAFQPIHRPHVPEFSSFDFVHRLRTPIDALLLKGARGLAPQGDSLEQPTDVETPTKGNAEHFAPEADRRTLVLRAYFDLVGLPPTQTQMQRWLELGDEDWFDQLITELLASPHYGERWARHWLDVVGYADSEGYTTSDAERPWAWKYRDWVIRSLNDDKPFDQFITEQLAGDELAGPLEGDLTADQIELLTATGYLRMCADGTGSGADDAAARNQVIADLMEIVGASLLGVSLQCAQCHDHRYDPLLQTDYYALRAVFEPALDWQQWKTPASRRVSLYTAADREKAAQIELEVEPIAKEKAEKQAEYMKEALEKELAKFDESLRPELRAAYETPHDQRTDAQKELLAARPSLNISPGVLYQYLPKAAEDLKSYDKRIGEIRAKKPSEEFLRALVEPANHVPETKLFHRGDHEQPKQTVEPAALTVAAPAGARHKFPIDDPALPSTGRRLAFARWLTSRHNPLTARVIVNRVWMHHFGEGLVASPADFGKLGALPTHPELLDWLADQFVVSGWSFKQLHRLIMSSTVWRQRADPHSIYPMRLRRLDAETLRDRMLASSGALDRTLYGRPVRAVEDGRGQVAIEDSAPRRSIYAQVRRSLPIGFLHTFDAPVMKTLCRRRESSTASTQSLTLLNGPFVLQQAAALAERVKRETSGEDGDPDRQNEKISGVEALAVRKAWQFAYCREPQPEELQLANEFLTLQLETLQRLPDAVPKDRTAESQALTNLCQSLLGSNEFLYLE